MLRRNFGYRSRWRDASCWLLFLVFLPALLVGQVAKDQVSTKVSKETAERILKVENGILPSIVPVSDLGQTTGFLETMAEENVPGMSVAVIDGGKIAWAKGYGTVEAGSDRAVTAETLFLAGSISKPVAATGALVMVRQGVLDLDSDVNTKLKSWKVPASPAAEGESVTLRRLLTHTAGLTVHGFPGYALGTDVPTVPEILDSTGVANTAPVRIDLKPGTEWRYSGGGYTVMQLLVEDAAGEPFEDFLKAKVLEPFGMARSTFENPLPKSRHPEAAIAHWPTGKALEAKWHTYPEMAAAGLWTTASDLARWAIGIQSSLAGREESVLDSKITREMLTAGLGGWGLGPGVRGEGETLRFSHGGRDEGFDAFLVASAETGQGAVVMINANNNRGFVQQVVAAVARAYEWPEWGEKQRSYVELPASRMDVLAGVYEYRGQRFTVRHTDGKLYAFTKGAPRLRLFPDAEGSFFVDVAPGTIVFDDLEDGVVGGFTWTRGDEDRRGVRQD